MARPTAALAALLLVALPLAGCLSGLGAGGGAGDDADAANASDDTASNEPLAFDRGAPDDATVGGAHVHDPWQGDETKVLFNAEVQAGDCQGLLGLLFTTVFTAAFQQRVERGCAQVRMDNGTLLPQGTGKLQIEGDATEALQSGGWEVTLWTSGGYYRGAPTSDPEQTWWFELGEDDWDDPHQSRTDLYVVFRAAARDTGEVAELDGPIDVTVTAHKIPNWTAPLAAAHVNHWIIEEWHDFVEPGVIEVLDANATFSDCSVRAWVEDLGCEYPDDVPLEDIVPPGTVQAVLLVTWNGAEGCAPEHECDFDVVAYSGSSWTWKSPAEVGDGWKLYVYQVPDDLPPDSTYANESEISLRVWWSQCLTVEGYALNCWAGYANWAPSADFRFQMEAWNHTADLDDVKARRLG